MNRRPCASVLAAATAILVFAGPLFAQQDQAPADADTLASPADTLPAPGVQGSPNPLRDYNRSLTGADLLDSSFPNSIPIPGSDVRFRIGGYARLDMIQDFDYVGDPYEFELATIPVEGTPEAALGGRTTFHAKQSRLNFDFRSKAKWNNGKVFPLQAFLEIDFFDDRPDFSLQPRLRHAYGVVGRILAGRTWTTSGDLEALPGTIDFSGGDALYGGRLAQIRWQDNASESVSYAVALEQPVTKIENPLDLDGANRAVLPNLGARIKWTSKGGSHVQLGGDLFQMNWQGGETGPDASAFGWGLNPTFQVLLGSQSNNSLSGGGSFGVGGAHRVVTLSFEDTDAVITDDGLDLMPFWQAYIGYSHYWTASLNSTISTNWTELDNAELQPGNAIHRAGSVHLNLVWFPAKLASVGGEIMWGERVNKDGASGDAWRLNLMVKYKFN